MIPHLSNPWFWLIGVVAEIVLAGALTIAPRLLWHIGAAAGLLPAGAPTG